MQSRSAPVSRASLDRVDEERVRKVAADNPSLLHCRLAQRFGISVQRLRQILGLKYGELITPKEMARAHYTPRPGSSTLEGRRVAERNLRKHEGMRKKLRDAEDEKRAGFNPDFVALVPSTKRGGP